MSALYAAAQQQMIAGAFTWAGGTYAILLVDGTYTPNFATDTTMANVPGGSPMCAPVAIPAPSSAGGVAKGGNVALAGVDTSRVIAAVLLIDLNVTESASPLIAYINAGVGIGVQPLSANLEIVWDARGIFAP